MRKERVIASIAAIMAACAFLPTVPGESQLRTELYFGASDHGIEVVSDDTWEQFLAAEVTPRFPDGLTVLAGRGQWREPGGVIHEVSRVLILVHPDTSAARASIEAIRAAYCSRFHQKSVFQVTARVKAEP